MAGLIACRSLLGIFEAGFGAGAPYFLSLFYQRRELGLRVSILLGMSPLANCFASALAYGITHIKTYGGGGWRYLFIIGNCLADSSSTMRNEARTVIVIHSPEGVPTILFAPVVFFFLADSPSSAKFLDEDHQTLALERLQTRDTIAKHKA